jgi:RsiW-degrading membrane proteinase PrsW (M82 family)
MRELLSGPGFLGLDAPFASDLSLLVMLLSAALLTLGRSLARRKRYEAHRWVQTTGVVLTTIVALGFMIGSFVKYILPGVPSKLLVDDYGPSTLHSLIGSAAVLLGAFVVLRANNLVPLALRFRDYKKVMTISYILYMLATVLGVVVYVMVFILKI